MKKTYLLLAFVLPLFVNAQSFSYQIKAMGVKAGTLEVSKKSVNGTDQYVLESHSSVDYLLGKIKVDHVTRCTYKDGVLQNSYVRNDKNDKVEYYSSISYDGTTYNITNEKGKKTMSEPVVFAICHIFFSEPVGKTEVFSDRFGEYVPLRKKGDHAYEITFPDGDKFVYYYENGKIVKADLPSPVGKAHLYLNP